MNMRLAIGAAYYALIKLSKKEDRITVEDKDLSVRDCKRAVYSLMHHVYPKMESDRFKKVVRCSECVYYKTQSSKKNPRIKRKICSVDKLPRKDDFYCANGIERGDCDG